MIYPVNYINITNKFVSGKHYGIDLGWSNKYGGKNQPVYAVDDGEVIYKYTQKTGGKVLHIRHNNGFVSEYGHLDVWIVNRGDKVKKGQLIGNMGNTGITTGNNLHFGLYKGTKIDYNKRKNFVNPIDYLYAQDYQVISDKTKANYNIKESSYKVKRVITLNGLNVRNRPSTSATIVGFLNFGDEVRVYETTNYWSKISNTSQLWAASNYLS